MNDLRIWVDDLLGRVTMYRLVIYGLIAIALTALALMFSGYLGFSPYGFLLGITVSVGISYIANRLFGWLFGLHPHAESAIITGLILGLLFTPPTTVLAVIKIMLVVIIANLSKYLFVYHGKHIFNPAAIAIVIAAASGLAYATWWIGSPALLPVTAIATFLILYKTQKLQMGFVFLSVAIVMLFVMSVLRGTVSPQNLILALTSWPLVFFAGIMLAEPLTLAPRRRQQLVIAALIGVLVTIDFHYSRLSMTPALALVIGNAIAFWFSIRRTVRLRFKDKKKQGIDGVEFVFDTTPFAFSPGQFIELTLHHRRSDSRGMRRIFSIIGGSNEPELRIATRFPSRPSSFKRTLLKLKPGQTIFGTRVAGDFVLPGDVSQPVVCIAGGIGITPFISFLQGAGGRKVTVLYSVKSLEDIMFVEQLKQYDATIVIVSTAEGKLPAMDWIHEKCRLDSELLQKYATVESHVYISGPPGMVTKTKETARQVGLRNIHTDQFSGY